MKTVATIEARMRSTRLPNKVLKPILGRPMLSLMIERLKQVPELDAIVVATTDHDSCDPIVAVAEKEKVFVWRGSEEDVLGRVRDAAFFVEADVIVQTTSDCPVIDPDVVSTVIERFRTSRADFCANIIERTYPRGLDVTVFTAKAVDRVCRWTNDPGDREHVPKFFLENPHYFRTASVTSVLSELEAGYRLTVDTQEDYDLIRLIFEALYPKNPKFRLKDILTLLEGHPALAAMNAHIQQKTE